MAKFGTASSTNANGNAKANNNNNAQQPQPAKQQQPDVALHLENTIPPHELPPPLMEQENPQQQQKVFRSEYESKKLDQPAQQPRLRGRFDRDNNGANGNAKADPGFEGEDEDIGHQIVPRLEEPEEMPEPENRY